MKKTALPLILLSLLSLIGCSDSSSSDEDTTDTIDTSDTRVNISSVVQEYFKSDNGVTVSIDEDTETITITSSTGLPDHKTPYWDVYEMEHELYEDFPTYELTDETYEIFYDIGTEWDLFSYDENDNLLITYTTNDNDTIGVIEYSMEIPMYPEEAAEKENTELSEIGFALNGVPIFNDWNRDSITLNEGDLIFVDSAGGHPGRNGDYHYHLAANLGIYAEDDGSSYPTVDDDNLVGFLKDGFPLYGRQEPDGTYPELDEYGGHLGTTDEFPDGIYHYHCSSEKLLESNWYAFKAGAYYGTPGEIIANF